MTTSFDPVDPFYREYDRNLLTPASVVFEIAPSTADLTKAVKALRIYNPTDGVAFIKLTTVGGNIETLPVPPGLTIESVRCIRVWATGTTADLIIHGYSD